MRFLAVLIAFLDSCFGTLRTPSQVMPQQTWLTILKASRINAFWIDPLVFYLPLGEHIIATVLLLVSLAVGNTSLCRSQLLTGNLDELSVLARKFHGILGMDGLEKRYFQVILARI